MIMLLYLPKAFKHWQVQCIHNECNLSSYNV